VCSNAPRMLSHVTIIWSTAAGAALLLGIVHALVWVYDRRATGNLAFAVAAVGLAGGAFLELEMMRAATPQQWGEFVWWSHIALFLLVTGMALFMRLYLEAGRVWLLAAVIAMRGLVLLLNLFSDPNFNFERIDAIGQITFLGEQVTVVTSAVTGNYQWVAMLASLLLPLFIIDVVVTLWRRHTAEARRRALLIGGPVLVSVILSWLLTQLVIWRSVELPILLTPPFFIALAAMSVEVSRDVVRAASLARDLRESEQRLEMAANAAGMGLWAWDSSSPSMWATDRTRAIVGLDPAAAIHLADVLRVVDPLDVRELKPAVDAALRLGGPHALQFRIVLPDGNVRWIAAQGTVELGALDKSVLVRGVVRDVTQQHRSEEEIHELREKLAHAGRVTMLGQLASALAHELSQPLSAIQHNVETAQILLARDPVDMPLLHEIIDDVLRDDRRAADVLKHLRAWLKQGRINREAVRMHELAHDVMALVRGEANTKRVAIECTVSRTLPAVRADRVQLSQVLLNLTMNAIEAVAADPGLQRSVSIGANVGTDGCCEVSVSDTGPGIAPDQLDKIFEPFVTAKSEGMGIGLSISRSIVEAHGGRLWAENGARGAIFHFTVPLQSAEQLQDAEMATSA
jgi:two-component system, LuxR family, sensor kinase FixL